MNPSTLVILNLLGGVALLLWGVRMVRTGILRVWEDQLKHFIEYRLGNRFSAFGAGLLATLLLGSGTATALIVTNIASTGSLPTALGFAVLLGADAGSSVVSSIVASGSNIALWTSPVFLFVGYIVFQSSEELKPHNAGRVMIGLGLMLLSLRLVSAATTPLNEATLFHQVLTAVGQAPVLAFLIGAAMAWAFHSTLASILLVASLLTNGSLELAGAVTFLLGINCGGGLPAFVATLGLPPDARRLPLANLLARAVLALVLLTFPEHLLALMPAGPFTSLQLALAFHVAFNFAVAVIFLPLVNPMSALVKRMIPDSKLPEDPLRSPRYLDATAIAIPAAAIANAHIELARMGEILERMFDTALKAMAGSSMETLKQLEGQDTRLNLYQSAIQSYVNDVSQGQLSGDEARHALEITLYASNLEHAGDIIQLNLKDRIRAKIKEGLAFDDEQHARLAELSLIIQNNIKMAAAVTASRDVGAAQHLIGQKDEFRQLENKVMEAHFTSTLANKATALRESALYIDIIRDLHRINSHIVAAGYPVVDDAGLLRGSRLRDKAKEKSV
ncbi:Na/Pi cotransporter family protein [Aestuariivirga litoralis]|uniref:Na/Pi cotransporter family protein n=1 Tax=Aestuariivirga litoralis TaxID=2650924 RepID=UPI0018C4D694|nr:Na/Pi cotransporter family protein [Aestuariivirga litoralis]MBG1232048.1 Na/Pi cotransporter family protein [Aestuariivirga litoralis]